MLLSLVVYRLFGPTQTMKKIRRNIAFKDKFIKCQKEKKYLLTLQVASELPR